MNPESQDNSPSSPDLLPFPADSPAPNASPAQNPPAPAPSGSNIENPAASPSTPEHRSRSKIGRLPKAIRDKLNFLVRDGLLCQDVADQLRGDAKDITARNISAWAAGPHYQRWLLEQDWLENLRVDQESGFDLLNDFDAARFNEAVLQLAITRLFLAFRHLDSGNLDQKLGGNAQAFGRLVTALARACRETTNIQKYRDACAKTVAAELKRLDPTRELSDREHEIIAQRFDDFFLKPRRKPRPTPPVPPESSTSNGEQPVAPQPNKAADSPLVPANQIQQPASSIQQPAPHPLTDPPTHPVLHPALHSFNGGGSASDEGGSLTTPVVPVPPTDSLAHPSIQPPPV